MLETGRKTTSLQLAHQFVKLLSCSYKNVSVNTELLQLHFSIIMKILNLLCSLSKKEHMRHLHNRNKVSVCLQLHFSLVL